MTESDEPELPRALPSVPVGSTADRLLRDALAVLRRSTTDPATQRLYDDILAGRRSARELSSSPDFERSAMRGLHEFEKRRAASKPAERLHEEEVAARLFDDSAQR